MPRSLARSRAPVQLRHRGRLARGRERQRRARPGIRGIFGRGPNGWFFERFAVHTAKSDYTLDGTINTEAKPTMIDLQVRAPRFAFQEWSGVIRGLRNIAVDAMSR